MRRLEFLRSGVAASIAATLPSVVLLSGAAEGTDKEPEGEVLAAQMIWTAESVPVPLKRDGPASGIASSSDGHPRILTPDLHAVFAREFTLEHVPSHASIRLFCYTRYRLYINGVYCGRGPSRYQNQRPEYDTREIATVLRPGRNLVAVLVHRDSPTGRIMRHDPGFAAVVQIGQAPTQQTIATGPSWLALSERSFGPRDEAWASIEEHIDARLAINLNDPALSLAAWPSSVSVGGADFLPDWPRTTPLQIEKPRAWGGEQKQWPIVLDLAQPLTLELQEIVQGYHDLEFDADDGTELEVEYLLPEGTSSYIARGGRQKYIGGDTFAHNRLSLRLKGGRLRLTRAETVEAEQRNFYSSGFQT